MKQFVGLVFSVLLFHSGYAQEVRSHVARYAILVPMNDESVQLLDGLDEKHYKVVDGVHYVEGRLNGAAVVFANTGLGKTNATAITARLIHDYHPEFIFLAGSAGSINAHIEKHSIVIGERIIDADLGTLTEQGPSYPLEEYFTTPQKNNALIPKSYAPNRELADAAQKLVEENTSNKLLFGSIATSDVLPNVGVQAELLKKNKIDAVEMEGSSFMQTCWLFDTKCIVVRGISNDADEQITKEDTVRAGNEATGFVEKIIGVLELRVRGL